MTTRRWSAWLLVVLGTVPWCACLYQALKLTPPKDSDEDKPSAWQDLVGARVGPAGDDIAPASSGSGVGISGSSEGASVPSVVLDQHGQPVVTWQTGDSDHGQIHAARYDQISGWFVPLQPGQRESRISDLTMNAQMPCLAADPTGETIAVVWQERPAGVQDWQLNGATISQGVFALLPAFSIPWITVFHPSVALAENKLVIAAVADNDSDPPNVVVLLLTSSSGPWSLLHPFPVADAPASPHPDVAIDPGGRIWLAWEAVPDSQTKPEIFVTRYEGTTWTNIGWSGSPPSVSNTPANDSIRPSLVVLADDRAMLAWQETDGAGFSAIAVAEWQTLPTPQWRKPGSETEAGFYTVNHDLAPTHGATPHLAVLPQAGEFAKTLYVAWEERGLGVFVRAYLGSGPWKSVLDRYDPRVGQVSARGAGASSPSLAVSRGAEPNRTVPTVVWQGGAMGQPEQIYLARCNCYSAWHELVPQGLDGVSAVLNGCSEAPTLAIAKDGQAIVAWHHWDKTSVPNNWEIFAARQSDDRWIGLGNSNTTGGVSQSPTTNGASGWPDMVLDADELPNIVWMEGAGFNPTTYLKRFADGAWSPIAGSATGRGINTDGGYTSFPEVAQGSANQLVVSWTDSTLGIGLSVSDGVTWTSLPSPAATTKIGSVSVAGDGQGGILAAWSQQPGSIPQVYAARWVAGDWTPLGNGGAQSPVTQGAAVTPSLSRTSDGTPVLAWGDRSGDRRHIMVARWDGTEWRGYEGSESGAGVSGWESDALEPSLAVDDEDQPIVAWRDDASGNFEIYLKRFVQGSWQEVAGSATGGGVSRTQANSYQPELKLRDGRLCVAWTDSGSLVLQVTARCIDL